MSVTEKGGDQSKEVRMMQPMTKEENIFALFCYEDSGRRYRNVAARECTKLLIREIDFLIDGSKSRLQVACSIGSLLYEFNKVGTCITDTVSREKWSGYIRDRIKTSDLHYRDIDVEELLTAIHCSSGDKDPTLSFVAGRIGD